MRIALLLAMSLTLASPLFGSETSEASGPQDATLRLLQVDIKRTEELALKGDLRNIFIQAKVCIGDDEKNPWTVTFKQEVLTGVNPPAVRKSFDIVRKDSTLTITRKQDVWEAIAPPYHIMQSKTGMAVVVTDAKNEEVKDKPILSTATRNMESLKKLFSQLDALFLTPGGEKPNPLDVAFEPFKELLDAAEGKLPAKKDAEPKTDGK